MSSRAPIRDTVVFFTGLAAVVGVSFFIVVSLTTSQADREFAVAVTEARNAIARAEHAEAAALLDRGVLYARSRRDWSVLIRLAYTVFELSHDVASLSQIATRASDAFPEEHRFAEVAAHALVRAGLFDDAVSLIDLRLDPSNARSLAAEAYLGAERYLVGDDIAVLTRLGTSEDADEFALAATVTKRDEFRINEALLRARDGRIALAYDAVHSATVPERLVALLAYDAGEFESFHAILRRAPPELAFSSEMMLLQGDVRVIQDHPDEAFPFYDEVATVDPSYSVVPHLNRAGLLQPDSRQERTLLEAWSRYPADLRVVHAVAAFYARTDRSAEALAVLRNPETRELARDRLAALEFIATYSRENPARYLSRLWILHNERPSDADVAALLASSLYAFRDFEGLRMLIDRAEEGLWTALYRGVIAFEKRDFSHAASAFETASGRYSAYGLYNAARLAESLGRRETATRLYDSVIETGSNILVSRAYAGRSRIEYANGNITNARREIERALAIDPEFHAADVFRRFLGD